MSDRFFSLHYTPLADCITAHYREVGVTHFKHEDPGFTMATFLTDAVPPATPLFMRVENDYIEVCKADSFPTTDDFTFAVFGAAVVPAYTRLFIKV